MKRLVLILYLFGISALGQNIRWDAQATTTTGTGQMLPVLALPGSQVNFFTGCTTLPCTTPAVTYISQTSSTACPSNAQMVWQLPVGGGCQATADLQGNFGGWFQPGSYQYVVQVSGITAGPYQFNVGGGGGSGGPYLPLTGGVLSGALFGPDINGEMYPATCGGSSPPVWCAGSTADAWYRAACTQLPPNGGIINLLGMNGTIAASAPCSTPTKHVITLFDPSAALTITETDGGIAFPQDDGSAFVGPGAGQCTNTGGGIRLASTANIAAIVGPAHIDGSQENFTASGLCLFGTTGATVSQGLIYSNHEFANTTISGNNVFECVTNCIKIVNNGQTSITNNWLNVSDGLTSITGTPLSIIGAALGTGCNVGPIDVGGGQIEHALGGGPEILVKGDGTGGPLACDIHIHDLGIERNPAGTPGTVGIQIEDCKNCTVENVLGTGQSSGSQDMVKIIANGYGSVANVVLQNISNIFGTYANTVNDTTPTGIVLSGFSQPFVTAYYSSPGYVEPPVLPGTTIQSVGTDILAGAGSFATGSGTLPTGFVQTGCNVSGLTCTYTRTNSSPPPGYSYSQEVQINTNTYGGSGFNGVQYNTPVSFTAGQTYIASFWGKGDGTFTGLPTFLLWNSLTPIIYCQNTANQAFSASWTLYSFACTPSTSGSANVAITALTPIAATGTFYEGGFIFSPVIPLTVGSILQAVSPYGIGPATDAQKTVTINSIPCELGGSCSVTSPGVSSINATAGAFTFSFSAGAGSCSGTTCTFTGAGTGGGSVTNFTAATGNWPTWLVPTVASSTTTPDLSVAAGPIPNSALANPTLTLGSTTLTLGATTTSVSGLTLAAPTLTGGSVLGTPASLTLTNATGLPWTGLTGSPSTTQVPVQTLTTTGTSGPATLTTGTLNIPQYGTTNTVCSTTIALSGSLTTATQGSVGSGTCTGAAAGDTAICSTSSNIFTISPFTPSTSGTPTLAIQVTTNTITINAENNTASTQALSGPTYTCKIFR